MTFDPELVDRARAVLDACRARGLKLATAESCTGGLIAACLTEVPGSSDVFDRAFVAYSNEAKAEMVDVSASLIADQGAVSEPVARAMAEGALARSGADLAIACTGIAGPGGGTPAKPVGLVHLALARRGGEVMSARRTFGDIGREGIREATVASALDLVLTALEEAR